MRRRFEPRRDARAAATTAAAGPSFRVSVPTASFAAKQSLAAKERLVIAVRNTGHRALPNVAVTICNTTCSYRARRGQGTTVQAFSYAIANAPNLANASRPIWIVQRAPGPCGYSCRNLGPGAAVTAYSNTWALGRLAPGHTARFVWTVTPVKAGRFVVAWAGGGGAVGRQPGGARVGPPGPREAGRARLDQAASLRRAAQRQGHHEAVISPRSRSPRC